ncbi:MAG: L-lactate dehydrogenase [bacterium]
MSNSSIQNRKVTIVGAGSVGSTFAYALAQSGFASEIVLTDYNNDLAEGQALDLSHGLPFYPPVNIKSGDKNDYADSRVIVITAGAKQHAGETRLDLLKKNSEIMEGIIGEIVRSGSEAVLVIVSNPVDILTHIALKKSGWESNRIIGSGTVLDSARFRLLLSQHCNIDARNIHAYILGEHGDSEVAAWSMTHLAGMKMDEFCSFCKICGNWEEEKLRIVSEVKNSAYHIIDYKGSTYYGVGQAMLQIVGAVLRNERRVLTVSTFLNGEYGLEDVCLSVPCIIGEKGIERIIEANLPASEQTALQHSGAVLKDALEALRKTNK